MLLSRGHCTALLSFCPFCPDLWEPCRVMWGITLAPQPAVPMKAFLGWVDAEHHEWHQRQVLCSVRDCWTCRLSRAGWMLMLMDLDFFLLSIMCPTPQRGWRTAMMCLTPNQQSKRESQPGKAISSQERDFKAHNLVSRGYTIWNITWVAGINFDLIFFGDNDFRKPIYGKCTWDRLARVQINAREGKGRAAEF